MERAHASAWRPTGMVGPRVEAARSEEARARWHFCRDSNFARTPLKTSPLHDMALDHPHAAEKLAKTPLD